MARFEILQTVEVTEDIPARGVKAGSVATIVYVFDRPDESEAYELEIVDEGGSTVAQLTVSPNQIRALAADGSRRSA